MAVATWQDVAVAIGRPSTEITDGQQAQISYWLNGAELVIKSRLGDVADLDEDTVKYVETEVVAEKLRRSLREESSITVAVDDGSVTRRYENRITDADFTSDLWSLFGSGLGGTAYSIPVTSPLDIVP